MKALGKNIRYQLDKNNLTQKYLAWKLGVTESTLSRWCHGKRIPSLSVVYEMSKIFGCTMDELVEGQMKFPTYKEFGEKVAKEALDTFEYNGKTLREWIEIIASNDGDTISRKAAIETAKKMYVACDTNSIDDYEMLMEEALKVLPSAQPEIIRCRECKFASGDSRICMKFDHSPIGELDFCSFAERREVNHESN